MRTNLPSNPMSLGDWTSLLIFLTSLGASVCWSAEPRTSEAGQKMILGFEREEIEKTTHQLRGQIIEAQDVLGRPYLRLQMKGGRITREWSLYEGNASQGRWAFGLGLTRWPDRAMPSGFTRKQIAPFENREAVLDYFGMFADNDWKRQLNTSGIHHTILPTDWSDYDLLRADVYCKDMMLEYRVAVEDEDILPPVVCVIRVPANQWTTLELDLRAAAKARGLDLKKITSMAVAVTGILQGELPLAKEPQNRPQLRSAARLLPRDEWASAENCRSGQA